MNTISFMTANYVGRQIGYNMTEGWMQGDRATQDYFKPVEMFPARFEEYLSDAKNLGYEAVDIWLAILHPNWATEAHISAANDLLAKYNLNVVSLAGGFGGSAQEFERSCKLAVALGTDMLGGNTALVKEDRSTLIKLLKQYKVKLGIENHPEKNPGELLEKIGGDGEGLIGATVDTGWFGTQGYDAAKALEELGGHLLHVHLKDVLEPGRHETCLFGKGCVPVRECVQTLNRLGYAGAISIEHEPEHGDPSEDCKQSLALVQDWLR